MNKFFLIFSLIAFYFSGCVSLPSAIKTGYLENYDRLEKGRYLENYWSDTNLIGEQKYSTIRIKEINIERISDQKNITAQNCRDWLYSAIKLKVCLMRSNFIFEGDSSDAQADLEVAITQVISGNFVTRLFMGVFGMGHVWVQVEGKVVDAKTNKIIAAFSDRRRCYGGLEGIFDIGLNKESFLVEKILEEIAEDIISELKEDFIISNS